MIKYVKEFDLNNNEASIVMSKDLENNIVKAVNKNLNNVVEKIKDCERINTLGLLRCEHVYVCNKLSYIQDNLTNEFENLVIILDSFNFTKNDVINLVEKIVSSRYVYTKYKAKKANEFEVTLVSEQDLSEEIRIGEIFGNAMNTTKDLVNTPHKDLNAQDLGEIAKTLGFKYDSITTKVFDKQEIKGMGMNAFLAVNQGSVIDPAFIYIKYQGKKEWKDPIALVGKGLMFDTGGYSLKAKASIPNMKTDMTGSACVIAAIEAIAQLELKENIIVAVPATDNAISGSAVYPDDVVKSMKGLTIEINNVDAEGRLILCDALTFVQQEGAKKVIDVATLTGGVITALGNEMAGAFTNDDELLEEVRKASIKSNEKIWHLPVEEFRAKVRNKSKIADLHNSPGGAGHASLAAAFLREFIEEGTSWVHLDIAGVSDVDGYATGYMTKTLINFFR